MNVIAGAEPPDVHDLAPAQLVALQADTAARLGFDIAFRDRLGDGQYGPEVCLIPAGVFEMGANARDRGFGEHPPHRVVIDKPFALGRFCVTADEFGVFAQETGFVWPEHLVLAEGRCPVTNINRSEANAYLAWLSEKSGHRYRLPGEAEWEFAARAGSATRYCFGDSLNCAEANTGSFQISGRSSQGWRRFLPFCAPMQQAVDVGLYPPNLWGLHDMHGNVWEFTADPWVGPVDALHSAGTGKSGKWFVTKGGSWFESAWQSRSAARKPRMWDELDVNLGFRVLREIP
jgi:formylglycine-generating enzyme required for sulfatase activity